MPYIYIIQVEEKEEIASLHSSSRDESQPIYAVLRLCSTFVTPYIVVSP